ncbi:MAG: class I SAM-dependent methyltransferase [Microscillaceae bacterium]|nr:class I SAM-dependent methyltransferase [Microscillaceae bacterium]MDW8461404.1 methyltransferase domain-containing protein [Cytophagales bacterium]
MLYNLLFKGINKLRDYYKKIIQKLKNTTLYLYFFIKGNPYCIKRGYIEKTKYIYFDDTPFQDEYQNEVYQAALKLAQEKQLFQILDYGCGSGYKLMKYFANYKTIGVEVEQTIQFLTKKYPNRIWLCEANLPENIQADLVICADVIEHLLNPQELILKLKNIPQVQYFVFSTVDRDILRGKNDWGPPKNPYHVREWNSDEFRRYLSQHFEILEHYITNYQQGTQMIICKKINSYDS